MSTPFNDFLGTTLVRAREGEVELALDLQEHHLNRRGVAHGGVVSSLLDSALGAAVISSIPKDWWCATTSLHLQFVGGARGGRVTAVGRLVRRGRHIAFARGEALSPDGKIVATAEGTWHLWPYRPDRPSDRERPYVTLRDGGPRIDVGKIVAVGRNYTDHIAEMGARQRDEPALFLKPPQAVVHDGRPIVLPSGRGEVHHELELVAVIGREARRVSPEDALSHVLGYAVGLDLTLRDVQTLAKQRGEPWAVSKGFDGSAPVSAVAPREEVGDGSGLDMRLLVGDELRQRGNTSNMIHSVAELVSFASRLMTLTRGDLLFTGTPAGVGPLSEGDRVHATIERVGELRADVTCEEG